MINGRKQVLLQDEVTASGAIQWRMHTNATIAIDTAGTTATLALDGKELRVLMVSPPSGARFTRLDPVRPAGMEEPEIPDQDNPGVSVLAIDLAAGTHTLQVLFNPQWEGVSQGDFVTPPTVALDAWSLRSHD